MAMFFSERKLVPSFMYRNVVGLSLAQRTRANELIVRLEFDFCQQGVWKNNFSVMIENHTPQQVLKMIRNYQEDVLEQIGMLEDIADWAMGDRSEPFQEVLMHERPVLFNCYTRKDTLTMQIFAENLRDLEIKWDTTQHEQVFLNKLEEMATIMRNHLADLDKVQLFDAVKVAA